ncbi:MAG: biopolymer transporter ExbD [Phycisphaeraceae bacterium]|nr:biopolymer transporter ExbD [Phycisphaeraceae bacterium]
MNGHFRRRNAASLREQHYGPNMTPMVDVVMVILIFFMASAAMLGPEWFIRTAIPIASARAQPPTDTPPPRIRLHLRQASTPEGWHAQAVPDGQTEPITLPPQRIAPYLLALAQSNPDTVLLILPEPEISYESVVRVHEAASRSGLTTVALGEPAPR